jgi:hypothetical protein
MVYCLPRGLTLLEACQALAAFSAGLTVLPRDAGIARGQQGLLDLQTPVRVEVEQSGTPVMASPSSAEGAYCCPAWCYRRPHRGPQIDALGP